MKFKIRLLTFCCLLCSLGAVCEDIGSLQVTIIPESACDAGAAWRRLGTGTWFLSEYTETGIPKGKYTVEFVQLPDWYPTPVEENIYIRADTTKRLEVTYSPAPIPGPDFEGCRLMNYGTDAYAPLPLIDITDIYGIVFSWPDGNYDFCAYMDTIYCSLDAVAQRFDERIYEFAHLVQCINADINGPLNEGEEQPLTGNGIPDGRYELALLAEVLNTPEHALHEEAMNAFQYNYIFTKELILQALAEYEGGIENVVRLIAPHMPSAMASVLAAYATLGDEQTFASMDELFILLEGIGIDPIEGGLASVMESVPELGPEGDANGDGVNNRQAYNWYVDLLNYTPWEYVSATLNPEETVQLVDLSGSGVYDVGTDVLLETTVYNGTPYFYSWYKDGLLLEGEEAANLVLEAATAEDAAVYRVDVQVEPDFDPGALITLSAFAEVQVVPFDLACHPADLNRDWRVEMSEAVAYLSGWQLGTNPMTNAIRAAYLWQRGEQYFYDALQAPPLCWQLAQ